MFGIEYYPTPKELGNYLVNDIDFEKFTSKYMNILEPSAGDGNLLECLIEMHKKFWNEKVYFKPYEDYVERKTLKKPNKFNIDCIEIDSDLKNVLKGKKFKVVNDNFLTFKTFKQYDLILMNPPFSNGDLHLLKAIDIVQDVGSIRCILNAETLRNPYTNTRKLLLQKLEDLNAKVEYMTSAFSNAERSTDVEIAIIRIDVHKEYECDLLKNLERDKSLEMLRETIFEEDSENQIVEREDTVTQLINRYDDEVRMSVKVINEVNAIKPLLTTGFNECDSPILTLHINGIDRNSVEDYEYDDKNLINQVIKVVRKKYWYALFESDELSKLMTDGLKRQYQFQLDSMSEYDFNKHNILQLKLDLVNNLQVNLKQAIVSCFDEFTKYHMDEYSSNIHYFNGWKTNKSWYINKRVIIPKSGLVGYKGNWDVYYSLKDELSTLEKVFNYLDNDYVGILDSSNNIFR